MKADDHILWIYDGHASHVSLDVIEWAKKKKIILFVWVVIVFIILFVSVVIVLIPDHCLSIYSTPSPPFLYIRYAATIKVVIWGKYKKPE